MTAAQRSSSTRPRNGHLSLTFEDFVRAEMGGVAWPKVDKALRSTPGVTQSDLDANLLDKPNVFHKLTTLASPVLDLSPFDIARAFGRCFFKALVACGYGKLIGSMGPSFVDWMHNLNNLHLHLGTMGAVQFGQPEFKVLQVTPDHSVLSYRTRRGGISGWVVGLLEYVALEFYDKRLNITTLSSQEEGGVQTITWRVGYAHNTAFLDRVAAKAEAMSSNTFMPDPVLFSKLFPFHFIMDARLNIVQTGFALRRFMPHYTPGGSVMEQFEIVAPFSPWDFEHLGSFKCTCFVLRQLHTGLVVRGAFHAATMPDGAPVLLYAGSPRLQNLHQIREHNMFMCDIPPHDMSSDFLVMAEQREIEAEKLWQVQTDKEQLQKTALMLEKHRDEAQQAVTTLKKSLTEALSQRSTGPTQPFDTDTPADKTMKLLTAILHGEQVNLTEVMDLRDALISSNGGLYQPINLLKNLRSFNKDKEVNQGLLTILTDAPEVRDLGSSEESDSMLSRLDYPQRSLSAGESLSLASPSSLLPTSSALTWDDNVQLLPTGLARAGSGGGGGGGGGGSPVPPSSPSAAQGGGMVRRRVSRHRSSILIASTMPDMVLTILKGPSDSVLSVLAKVDDWAFDPFQLAQVTNGHPLSTLTFHLVKKCGLMPGRYGINETRLARFLCAVEEGYNHDTPYHNAIHAADVVRSLYVLLTRGGVVRRLCSEDNYESTVFAALIAATVHDFEHKGVNNEFLIKSSDPLALLYNDHSPMENHHLAAAFKLMLSDEYNFFKYTSPKVKADFRKTVIAMVLATDMKQHFSISSMFNTKLGTMPDRSSSMAHRLSITTANHSPRLSNSGGSTVSLLPGSPSKTGAGAGAAAAGSPATPATPKSSGVDEEAKLLGLQMALKCSDLGHLCAPRDVHIQWVNRLEEEFFRQGDMEKAEGLTVSALMDRTKMGVSKCQPGFFQIVAIPQFQAFCRVFPDVAPMRDALLEHYKLWQQITSGGPAGEAAGRAVGTGEHDMLLPIRGADGAVLEWAMIELQGKVESTHPDDPSISEIGTLQLAEHDKNVVQLVIGYHQLEGKRVALKKPFAILDKVAQDDGQGKQENLHYKVVGVVRSKLLFKNRPTALISKPQR